MMTAKEFFTSQFSKQEYKLFTTYMDKLNEDAKLILRYNTVVSPTTDAICLFKQHVGETICGFPYDDFTGEDIFQSQKSLLRNNYLSRGLWRAMIGTKAFADSFVTSEWYYNVYTLTENFDLTGIVAGYLKSIEQLIFSIISLSSNTGVSAKNRFGQVVEFSAGNESIDTTLGSLESILRNNNSLFNVNPYVKNYIINTVKEWREKQRNGYFHKHNLYSLDKVDEIREKAYLLYYLILGGCSIQDEQFELLGIAETKEMVSSFDYETFVSWLERSLTYGCPKDAIALKFVVDASIETKWRVRLDAIDRRDINEGKWVIDAYFNEYRRYSWGKKPNEYPSIKELEAPIADVVGALEKYIVDGSMAGRFKDFDFVAVIGESLRSRPHNWVYKHIIPLHNKELPSTPFDEEMESI